MSDLSIIIVSWNTCQILEDCLRSILEQTSEIDYEIYVIDNASQDGSADMVRSQFPSVRLIENTDNRGFAAANNQAIREATGRYILLLNSDTVVLDHAIAKMVQFADSRPEVGMLGCRILNPDRTLQPSCFMYPSVLNMLLAMSYLYKIFPKSSFFGREFMTGWDRDTEREVEAITGCVLMARKEVVDEIGGLDEAYFMYCEETDWCYQARQQGWKILFTPTAEIIHLGGASSKQIRSAMLLQKHGSILLFMKKNKGILAYAAACVLTSLFFMLRVPHWLLRGLLKPQVRKHAWQICRTYAVGSVLSLCGAERLKYKANTTKGS